MAKTAAFTLTWKRRCKSWSQPHTRRSWSLLPNGGRRRLTAVVKSNSSVSNTHNVAGHSCPNGGRYRLQLWLRQPLSPKRGSGDVVAEVKSHSCLTGGRASEIKRNSKISPHMNSAYFIPAKVRQRPNPTIQLSPPITYQYQHQNNYPSLCHKNWNSHPNLNSMSIINTG